MGWGVVEAVAWRKTHLNRNFIYNGVVFPWVFQTWKLQHFHVGIRMSIDSPAFKHRDIGYCKNTKICHVLVYGQNGGSHCWHCTYNRLFLPLVNHNLLGLPSTTQTWQWTIPQLYRCFFLKCQFSSGISPAMFDYQVEVLHLLMASLGTQQQVTQTFTTSYPGPTARMTATLVAPWCARWALATECLLGDDYMIIYVYMGLYMNMNIYIYIIMMMMMMMMIMILMIIMMIMIMMIILMIIVIIMIYIDRLPISILYDCVI